MLAEMLFTLFNYIYRGELEAMSFAFRLERECGSVQHKEKGR